MMPWITYHLSILLVPIIYVLIHFFGKHMHHRAIYYRIGALALSLLTVLLSPSILDFFITSGHLGLALFIFVIFAGVLKKQSVMKKKITLIRGDLAIIGYIFLIPHALARLSLALSGYNMSGLIAMIIFTPLFISSFMTIRKKIRPDRWKNLHKLAYITYLLIYIHLGFNISVNPNNMYIRISPYGVLYHVLFILYLVLRYVYVIYPKLQTKKRSLT